MHTTQKRYPKLVVAIAATLALAACASSPPTPEGAVTARNSLTRLQADPELASRASIEIQDAELAVIAAERPESDQALSTHLVLLANRKVETAALWAQSRLYEDQRAALSQARDVARLEARTQEANAARRETQYAQDSAARARASAANAQIDANVARNDATTSRNSADIARRDAATARSAAIIAQGDAAVARNQADSARSDATTARSAALLARDDATIAQDDAAYARNQADAARRDSAAARLETENLESQLLAMNARNTDRGLVVTLGDVLFATGNSSIVGSNDSNLGKLAVFLNRYDDRAVTIEGHTDSVGNESSNMVLSQQRADAVKNYLIGEGVAASRLRAEGKGENSPVSGNDTATGRQQNRRVEVIIANSSSTVSSR